MYNKKNWMNILEEKTVEKVIIEKVLLRLTNNNCSPPCSGGSGYAKHQSGFALCGVLSPPHLGRGTFASQSPYSGWQNVSYLERYVTFSLKMQKSNKENM